MLALMLQDRSRTIVKTVAEKFYNTRLNVQTFAPSDHSLLQSMQNHFAGERFISTEDI